jgi:hypothetical protein
MTNNYNLQPGGASDGRYQLPRIYHHGYEKLREVFSSSLLALRSPSFVPRLRTNQSRATGDLQSEYRLCVESVECVGSP